MKPTGRRTCEVVEDGVICGKPDASIARGGDVSMCPKHRARFVRYGTATPPGIRSPRVREPVVFHMPTREEIAWAGGLFEGEGCFAGRGKSSRGGLSAILAMTDFDIVERFHSIVGVGVLSMYEKTPPHRHQLRWQTNSFEETQFVACLLWRWLGPRRRGRAAELATAYLQRPGGRIRGTTVRLHETDAWVMFRKRDRDLTIDEKRALDRAKSQRDRDAKRAARGLPPIDYTQTHAYREFGKRERDLTPEEHRVFQRHQVARDRAKRKARAQDGLF